MAKRRKNDRKPQPSGQPDKAPQAHEFRIFTPPGDRPRMAMPDCSAPRILTEADMEAAIAMFAQRALQNAASVQNFRTKFAEYAKRYPARSAHIEAFLAGDEARLVELDKA